MTLIKAVPDNRGNFGQYEENLPVYSRDVNQCIRAIEELQSAPSGGGKIIASGEFNLKDLYESASLTIDITSFPDVGNPDTTVVKLDGVELFTIPTAFFADEAEFIDYLINATAGNPSYGYDGFIALGYPCSTTGVSLTINAPNGTGESYNGKIITIEKGAGGTCIFPINAEFTGGVDSGAENILTWIGDNTAANTAPTGVIVALTENDTYVPYSVPVEASTSFTITNIGSDGDTIQFDSLTDGLSPIVYTKTLFEVDEDAVAAAIAALIDAQSGVNDVGATSAGAVVTLTYLSGGATNNGISLPTTITGTIAYSGGADFSGGADVTDFSLKLNGEIIKDENLYGFMTSISQLTLNNLFSQGMLNTSIFSNSGDWALPVTAGTQDDFRIKISILGERTD